MRQRVQALPRSQQPIADKQQLVLRYHRPFHTQHDIDPRRVFGFDGKGGVSAVLAAHMANPAIDNTNFAVVAHIKPP